MSRRRRQDGVAALELALVLTLLLTLLAGVVPLAALFLQRVELGRVAGDTARFATARADTARTVTRPDGFVVTVPGDFLPDDGGVAAEAQARWGEEVGDPAVSVVRTPDDACPGGRRVRITLTTTVSAGPLGALLGTPTQTLTATADSCEE